MATKNETLGVYIIWSYSFFIFHTYHMIWIWKTLIWSKAFWYLPKNQELKKKDLQTECMYESTQNVGIYLRRYSQTNKKVHMVLKQFFWFKQLTVFYNYM